MPHCQILNPCIPRWLKIPKWIPKELKIMVKKFGSIGLFAVHLKVSWRVWKYNLFEVTITRIKILHWFLFFKFSSGSDQKW